MAYLQHFTNRERQIAAFNKLWQGGDRPWIVVYTGLSGHGKSTLLDWLIEKQCKPHNRPYTKVDLYSGLDQPAVLDRLAGLLPPPARNRFYRRKQPVVQDFHTVQAELRKAAMQQPVNIDAKQIATGGGHISQTEMRIQTGQSDDLEALRRSHYDQLTHLLLAEQAYFPTEPSVIFLDTYEHAQESSPETEQRWLWELLAGLYALNPQLRVVVGSRVDVAYRPVHPWCERLPLEAFSRPDSDAFLRRWSSDELPAELQAAIFKLAEGHPMLTEMAAQLWRDGQQAGQPLTPAELRAGLHARSAEEWLYGRIINRLELLGDARLVAAARYGPLLRHFNLAGLNAILPEAIPPLDDPAFRRLTGYAFIKTTQLGRSRTAWLFHELMRRVQLDYLANQEDPAVEACHRRAAAYFAARAQTAPHNREHRRNRLYHACFLDPAEQFEAWLDETFQAQLAGDRAWWAELLDVMEADAQAERLSPNQQGGVLRKRGMWHVRGYTMTAALHSYRAALALFQQVGDRLGEAYTRQAIGDVQNFRDDQDAALHSYQAALALFQQVGDRLGEANTRMAIGDVQNFRKELDAALASYQAALALFQQVGSRLGEANTRKAIGDVQYFRKELDAALHSYQAALALFQQVGDRLGEANTRQAIGDVHNFRADYDAALASYQAALALFQQVGDRLGEAYTRKAIGDVQNFRKELDAALHSYQAALALFQQVGDRLGEANTLRAIGDVQKFRDDHDAALASYQAALALFQQVGDRLGEANTQLAIGDVQYFRDDHDAALASYQAALALFQQVGDRLGEAYTRKAIGDVQNFRDDHDAALASYQAALALFQQVGSRLGEANTRKAIGDVQNFRQELDAAISSYQAALALFQQVGDRLGEANTLRAIGDVQYFRKELDAALASYQAALALFQQVGSRLGEANTLRAIGDVHNFRADHDAALASYQAALALFQQVGDRLGEANTRQAIGMFQLDQGQVEEGLDILDQALTLYRQVGGRSGQANIYWSLGVRLAQNGNLKEAESLIAQAVELGNQFAPGHPVTVNMEKMLAQIRADLNDEAESQ